MTATTTARLKKAYEHIEHLEDVIAKLKFKNDQHCEFINLAFVAHPNLDADVEIVKSTLK